MNEKLQFRRLTASEIECRAAQVKADGTGASILLYKDARVDQRLLDEVVGTHNWKREHLLIGDELYCTVSIWDEGKQQWVSKQDVGVPSNTEAVKGRASDAFKRACFNWGIGRELYTAPFIWVNLNPQTDCYKGRSGAYQLRTKLSVAQIGYSESGDITTLTLKDDHGNVRYTFGTNGQPATAPAKPAAPSEEAIQEAIDDLRTSSTDRQSFEQAWARHKDVHAAPAFRQAAQEIGKKYPKS